MWLSLQVAFHPCALFMPSLGVLWDSDHPLGDPHAPLAAARARTGHPSERFEGRVWTLLRWELRRGVEPCTMLCLEVL